MGLPKVVLPFLDEPTHPVRRSSKWRPSWRSPASSQTSLQHGRTISKWTAQIAHSWRKHPDLHMEYNHEIGQQLLTLQCVVMVFKDYT
ncbi:hypothetical protein ACRE_013590 [Hapsidospora chrysogenum ATCC 11550]|uniref:Uncharacterized protein n=1 Tax=Hapsidospora chrysogenum (strain ATCC 11550 / CBS 779.69 / DSM 880 / IAM 14645 / JCM 23072 / IMI 49137) TaxID=857340 RepID=A0A086TEQ5_HAPC1|nr:hypothetical protein ACRE_013590 [Hapsidospora chrysogenum ATCC 11550]